jgi:hypothetical protein
MRANYDGARDYEYEIHGEVDRSLLIHIVFSCKFAPMRTSFCLLTYEFGESRRTPTAAKKDPKDKRNFRAPGCNGMMFG